MSRRQETERGLRSHQNRCQPFPFQRPLAYGRSTPVLHHVFPTVPAITHLGGVIVLGRQAGNVSVAHLERGAKKNRYDFMGVQVK
ncbi:hypothetical protein AVEN_203129-1 [Araneus ventricosus]|uniref:Uncharacterized protein n=1 Tax=Araneus ventricosus TaxID=182803 RepID=A0A4Y2AKD5_ARAVE|nr:hypothetical protein AVEN_203129-1 [Araneus ventricosus]